MLTQGCWLLCSAFARMPRAGPSASPLVRPALAYGPYALLALGVLGAAALTLRSREAEPI